MREENSLRGRIVDFFHRRFFFLISITIVLRMYKSFYRDEYCEKRHTVVVHECVVAATAATAHAHV